MGCDTYSIDMQALLKIHCTLKILNNSYRCSIDQEGNVLKAAHFFLNVFIPSPLPPKLLQHLPYIPLSLFSLCESGTGELYD
jgi:hypothetical protein